MKISSCDMCARPQPDYALTDLLSSYKTRQISKLCPECAKQADDHLEQLRLVNHKWYSRMLKIWLRHKRMIFRKVTGES